MIYNTIMVQLDLDASPVPRLRFGWELAQRFEADMIAFAAAETKVVVPMGDSGIAAAEMIRRQSENIEARLKALERDFQTITNDDPRASWRGYVGNPTGLLAFHARAADLIVSGTPSAEALGNHRGTVDAGALILAAGRPVLLVADNLSPVATDTVIVAWKDSREARRAVVDAMPFLTQAQQVLVVTVQEGDLTDARDSTNDVVRFLMKHSVKARSEVVDLDKSLVVEVLTEFASESGANLIVAGGYGHSRLREWAFGGVTRSLLGETTLHRFFSN